MTDHIPFRPRLGALVEEGGVRFRIWAPKHRAISLVLDDERDVPLKAEGDGYFSTFVEGVGAGQRYWYRLPDGLRPDPASRWQPDGPLGASVVVDPRAFQWTDAQWPGAPPPHRHVFYEMHIGTYTPGATWAAAAEHLPALADLGITTIEVMPIAEFSGRFGWGYDGVDLFAPTRLYGTPDEARRFVDRAHRHGLAVILDVVYNHLGPVGNFIAKFSDTFFGKPGDWGDTINYDGEGSAGVRAFVIENVAHWIHEYHFDGLRFDATHGISDGSAEHIVSEMCRAARQAAGSRRIFLVGESEPQDTRLLRQSGVYRDGLDAIWNEDWHHSAYVALTGRRQAYFTDYYGTANEFASMARHGTLYQGQWYSWQKAPRGGFAMGLPSSAFVNFLENHDQVANTGLGQRLFQHADAARWRTMTALLLLGPAMPLLFQGQEFASSRPFTYFADHDGEVGDAVRKGRHEFLAQFPGLRTKEMQELLGDPRDETLFRQCTLAHEENDPNGSVPRLYRDLIRLRKEDAVLSRLGTADVIIESSAPAGRLALIRYRAAAGDRLLLANMGDDHRSTMNDALFAPPAGQTWRVIWSSERAIYGGGGVVDTCETGPWLIAGASATLLASVATT